LQKRSTSLWGNVLGLLKYLQLARQGGARNPERFPEYRVTGKLEQPRFGAFWIGEDLKEAFDCQEWGAQHQGVCVRITHGTSTLSGILRITSR
jgi:hypothetical protein